MTNHLCAFVFCTSLFTKTHVHFTTPNHLSVSDTWHYGHRSDSIQVLVVSRQKEYSRCSTNLNTFCFCFYKMLINAVAVQNKCCKSNSCASIFSDLDHFTAMLP